ncbi:MAG: DUF2723 domain-containing protein [Candidatus Eisenbacteria bacterium]|nr:DUF2723 domain-containing protein [Candidatus Eisenbacteria bacterium]
MSAHSPTWPMSGTRDGAHRWRWIALAFLGALAIYATGAAPTVLEGDSGELQAVALAGGVAHSSGYPLFCLVSRVFALLPGDPAFRINLMSAFFGAAGVATLVLAAMELGVSGAAALGGAIVFGAGFSWWSASLRAEVYTLSLFVMLLAWRHVNLALRTRAPKDRIAAAVLLGVACTGHLSHLGAVAFLGLVLAWAAWREGRTWPEWPALVGAFVLGLTPYLYLVWADRVNLGFDYLDYVDHIFYPGTGVPDARLDGAFERLRWLVFGRNLLPGTPMEFHPGDLLRAIRKHCEPVVLFELGLPVTALVLPGFVRLWRLDSGAAIRVFAIVAASLLLAAQVSFGGLFALFLLFPLALLSLLAALGIEWAAGSCSRVGPRAPWPCRSSRRCSWCRRTSCAAARTRTRSAASASWCTTRAPIVRCGSCTGGSSSRSRCATSGSRSRVPCRTARCSSRTGPTWVSCSTTCTACASGATSRSCSSAVRST